MSAVRRLVPKDNGWQMETSLTLAPTADRVGITVDIVLLPPQAQGYGLWVGNDASSPNTLCAGWGPAMDSLSVKKEDFLALPKGDIDPLTVGLLVPACAVVQALKSINPGSRVAVTGEGLLAELATTILASQGFSLEQPQPGGDLDLLVDTQGEPTLWTSNLSALRSKGTLLLLVPPWSKPANFDFYPEVHRRSLLVMARRWHNPPRALDRDMVAYLRPVVSAVVHESQWLRPLDSETAPGQHKVWLWVDWTSRGAAS